MTTSTSLLQEALALFRFYEESHRQKGKGHEEKVRRNQEIADRIEEFLNSSSDSHLPNFDDFADNVLDSACATGGLFRIDLRRAYDVLRENFTGTPVPASVTQQDEPVAWLHQCNKRPDLRELSFMKVRPDLSSRGYKPMALYAAPQHPPVAHTDDLAVEAFAAAMKAKLADARAKGRSGWQTCRPEVLSEMLRDHVEKGDPRDVANFCMFLWTLGSGITAPLPGSEAFDRWVGSGMGLQTAPVNGYQHLLSNRTESENQK